MGEASRPAAQSAVLSRVLPQKGDSNKAQKAPGPREQAFQMNSTHRNRKQDTI
jgi:hypothetical protein